MPGLQIFKHIYIYIYIYIYYIHIIFTHRQVTQVKTSLQNGD